MRKNRWKGRMAAFLLLLFLAPLRALAAGDARMEITGNGQVTLRMQDAARAGISSLQFSLAVEPQGNGASGEISVEFAPDGALAAEVVEAYWHADSGLLNVYVAGEENLFQSDSLTLGSVAAYNAAHEQVGISVSVAEDSLRYVEGDEMREVTELVTPVGSVAVGGGDAGTGDAAGGNDGEAGNGGTSGENGNGNDDSGNGGTSGENENDNNGGATGGDAGTAGGNGNGDDDGGNGGTSGENGNADGNAGDGGNGGTASGNAGTGGTQGGNAPTANGTGAASGTGTPTANGNGNGNGTASGGSGGNGTSSGGTQGGNVPTANGTGTASGNGSSTANGTGTSAGNLASANEVGEGLYGLLESTLDMAEKLSESDYSEESYQKLRDAIEAAEKLLNDPEASREEIEEAILQLEDAMGALKPATDTSTDGTAEEPGEAQQGEAASGLDAIEEPTGEESGSGHLKSTLLWVIVAAVVIALIYIGVYFGLHYHEK